MRIVRGGVSFVEIVMAILILGIVVGPVIYSFSSINRGTTSSIYEMMAAQAASELLEQVRSLPLNAILETRKAGSLTELTPGASIPSGGKALNKLELVSGVFLFYSELPAQVFKKRELRFEAEKRQAGNTTVRLLKATVTVEWEIPGMPKSKRFSACTYVMEP